MIKLSTLQPEGQIFVFDTLYSEKSPTLYQVRDFIEAYKERPEDFGKAVVAWKKAPELERDWIKEILSDCFNDRVIESEHFYGGDNFTTDDLWDEHTLRRVTMFLESMLSDSGYFVEPGPFEIDYQELAPKKPEAEPDPAPSRKEILEEKKERYLRILIAEVRSLLLLPPTLQANSAAQSTIERAAFDLGEAVYELEKLEKEENHE